MVSNGLPSGRHRFPYVGDGVDGALRSARIDEEEAEMLDPGERRDALLLSAERWRMQADELADANDQQ